MLGVHGFFAVAVLCTFGARPSTGAEAPSLPIWCFGTDSRQRNTNLSCHRATGKIVREALRGGGRPFPVQLPGLAKSSLSQGRAPPALAPNGAFSSISAASSESSPGLLALTWPQEPLPHLGQTLCTLPPSTEGCRATTNPGLRGGLPQKKNQDHLRMRMGLL